MGPLALNDQHSPPPSSEAPSPTSTPRPGLEGSPTRAVEWNKAPAGLWGWGLLDPEPHRSRFRPRLCQLPAV